MSNCLNLGTLIVLTRMSASIFINRSRKLEAEIHIKIVWTFTKVTRLIKNIFNDGFHFFPYYKKEDAWSWSSIAPTRILKAAERQTISNLLIAGLAFNFFTSEPQEREIVCFNPLGKITISRGLRNWLRTLREPFWDGWGISGRSRMNLLTEFAWTIWLRPLGSSYKSFGKLKSHGCTCASPPSPDLLV